MCSMGVDELAVLPTPADGVEPGMFAQRRRRLLLLLSIVLALAMLGSVAAVLWSKRASDLEAAEVTTRNLSLVLEEQTSRSLLAIDGALTAGGATVALVEQVAKAGPFGSGNPEPVFAFPNHRLAYVETFGNGHIRARLASNDGAVLKAVAFRCADEPLGRAMLAARGRLVHLAGTLDLDHWQGETKVSIRIRDMAQPA